MICMFMLYVFYIVQNIYYTYYYIKPTHRMYCYIKMAPTCMYMCTHTYAHTLGMDMCTHTHKDMHTRLTMPLAVWMWSDWPSRS